MAGAAPGASGIALSDVPSANAKPVGYTPASRLSTELTQIAVEDEITGVHVADGDPGVGGILGAKVPHLSDPRWRWFYTQQHGDNTTWQVVPAGYGG